MPITVTHATHNNLLPISVVNIEPSKILARRQKFHRDNCILFVMDEKGCPRCWFKMWVRAGTSASRWKRIQLSVDPFFISKVMGITVALLFNCSSMHWAVRRIRLRGNIVVFDKVRVTHRPQLNHTLRIERDSIKTYIPTPYCCVFECTQLYWSIGW